MFGLTVRETEPLLPEAVDLRVDVSALDVPDRREARTIDRSMAAIFLDLEMRKLMRALPIVDLLLGRALRSALVGRFEQAGYARPGDYCQQELGFTLRTAQLLMRSWQQMEAHPLVEQAFLEGRLAASHARLLLDHAGDLPGGAEGWIEQAAGLTVRALRERIAAAVRSSAVVGGAESQGDEANRADDADEDSGDVPTWRAYRLSAAAFHEFRLVAELKAFFEASSDRCAFFAELPVVSVSRSDLERPLPGSTGELPAFVKDFADHRFWRDSLFVSVTHYASERLGLGRSTAARLIARERGFLVRQPLYQAVMSGAVGLSHAELLARIGPDRHFDAWLRFAGSHSYRRFAEAIRAAERQEYGSCGFRGDLDPPPPEAVPTFSPVPGPGDPAAGDAASAVPTFSPPRPDPQDPGAAVIPLRVPLASEAAGYRCMVPVCTARQHLHVHHIVFRLSP